MIKRLLVTVDGKPFHVTVEVLDAPTEPTPGQISTPVAAPVAPPPPTAPPPAPVPPTASAPVAKPAGAGDVPSPLTGRVVAINVQKGQQVKEGEHVLTLEAMKMNTHVFAGRPGTVTEIKVAVGDAVEEGQALMTIG